MHGSPKRKGAGVRNTGPLRERSRSPVPRLHQRAQPLPPASSSESADDEPQQNAQLDPEDRLTQMMELIQSQSTRIDNILQALPAGHFDGNAQAQMPPEPPRQQAPFGRGAPNGSYRLSPILPTGNTSQRTPIGLRIPTTTPPMATRSSPTENGSTSHGNHSSNPSERR